MKPVGNALRFLFRSRGISVLLLTLFTCLAPAAASAQTPGHPRYLAADIGDGQVTLHWGPLVGNRDNIAYFQYRQDDGGWTRIPGDGSTGSYIVTGLTNGRQYRFYVRAVNTGGQAGQPAVTVALPVPDTLAAPTNLMATPYDGKVFLQWTRPSGFIATWQYSLDNGSTWQPSLRDQGTNSYTVTGLTNGTPYTFRVRVINHRATSAGSGPASATPQAGLLPPRPGAPANMQVIVGNTRIQLLWDAPAGPITSWEYQQNNGAWAPIPGSGEFTRLYIVEGLSNGTPYTFRVRAVNDAGAGPQSSPIRVTPQGGNLPVEPTGLTASPGNGQVTLVWTAGTDATVTRWEYSHSHGNQNHGENWTAIPGGAEVRTHTVTGLTNGTRYTFYVRAFNGLPGNPSPAAVATPTPPTPLAPTKLTVSPGNGQVRLSWTAVTDTSITTWSYSPDDGSTWTVIPGSSAATRTYTVTGLTNDTTYTFRVRAANNVGAGAASDAVRATPRRVDTASGVPDAPTGLTASPGNGQVILAWTATTDATITSWGYSPDDGSTWTVIPGSSAATRTHTVGGLTNGTAYTFRVRATNDAGDGAASDAVSATPTAPMPGAPTNVTATPGDAAVTLAWTADADTTVTGWEYSPDDGSTWTAIPGSQATTRMYTVGGLTNGRAYIFRVRAVRGQEPSAASGSATATPRSANPQGFLENPVPNSFQSGIGVISGWICEAGRVTIEINDLVLMALYGTERVDTHGICGDFDNGFGLLFNWNRLGDGLHTVVAKVDGVELARAQVQVTTLGEEFVRGVTGRYPLSDFPGPGRTTTVVWQEAVQNFVLAPSQPAPTPPPARSGERGVLENPGNGSLQSGIGVISGWVCEAEMVEVLLIPENTTAWRFPAAYGMSRPDTAQVCGDSDNGFGVLFNWNRLGPGTYTAVLLVDNEERANHFFTVTTLGEEFARGLTGRYPLSDFPAPGETVTIEWQEALQNFVIVAVE